MLRSTTVSIAATAVTVERYVRPPKAFAAAIVAAVLGSLTGCATDGTLPAAPHTLPLPAVQAAATPLSTRSAELTRQPRHVMLFISDGASWGTWHMASYHEHGALGRQPYDAFDVKLGMTTFPMSTATRPGFSDQPAAGYDPTRAWDGTPQSPAANGAQTAPFEGYAWIKRDATDSAAAATALASGHKTHNGAINIDNHGRPLDYATLHAKARGLATGVITSVPFSHATPAAFGARSASRSSTAAIGDEMIDNPALDVIMGAGHPLFDINGQPRSTPQHGYLSAPAWARLTGAQPPRHLLQTLAEFEALAEGRLQPRGPVLGLAPVHDTLQANRQAAAAGADPRQPSGVALLPTVPSLALMTRGALRLLGRQPQGFFLMVEGGAVDWKAHANDTARIIEEQTDFNHAVRAAVDWVQTHSHWGESLVIVLTDHGNGLPMGPQSDTVPFQPVENRGVGVLPGVRWHHGSHSNELTLLWAHGAGAEALRQQVRGHDPALVQRLGHNADGAYIDNTAIGQLLAQVLAPQMRAAPR
jgi:alkaline phosphatase